MNQVKSNDNYKTIINDKALFKQYSDRAFRKIDSNRSGSIEFDELGLLLNALALEIGCKEPTKQDIQGVMNQLDKNKDGRITQDEFEVLARVMLEHLANKK